MTNRYLSAHTPATSPYPPFINLSETIDGEVQIILRGPPCKGEFSDQDCGPTVTATFAKDDVARLLTEALRAMKMNGGIAQSEVFTNPAPASDTKVMPG